MPIRTTTLSRMRQMMTSVLNEANLVEYMLRLSSCSGGGGAPSPTDSTASGGTLDMRGARTATATAAATAIRRPPLLPVGCVYQLLSARSASGAGAVVSSSSTSAFASRTSSIASGAMTRSESSPFDELLCPQTSASDPASSCWSATSTAMPTRIPLRDWLLRYMLDASLEQLDPQLPALIEAFTRLSVSAPLGPTPGANEIASPFKAQAQSTPSTRFGTKRV